MNQASDMLTTYSKFGFFGKKVTIFIKKNFKIDNCSYRIKNKTRQNKELKYRRKNICSLNQTEIKYLPNSSKILKSFKTCIHG